MGYTTEFQGKLTISPPLPAPLVKYINQMAETRRMKRNLPAHFGVEGEFYVEGTGFSGQDHDATVIEYNTPPSTQPSLWLQWNISEDGTTLAWDENEKFYSYVTWLAYLYKQILLPLGYELSGSIKWRGEEFDDTGEIQVGGAVVSTSDGEHFECTPDEAPRFIEFLKVVRLVPSPAEETKDQTIRRLLDQLDDVADMVESRSKAQATNIRHVIGRLREVIKG